VAQRLNNFDKEEPTNELIADLLINFKVKPAELYRIELKHSYMYRSGIKSVYRGIISYETAEKLINIIQKYDNYDPVNAVYRGVFSRYLKKYNVTPSELSRI
jgi:hypothetical protein